MFVRIGMIGIALSILALESGCKRHNLRPAPPQVQEFPPRSPFPSNATTTPIASAAPAQTPPPLAMPTPPPRPEPHARRPVESNPQPTPPPAPTSAIVPTASLTPAPPPTPAVSTTPRAPAAAAAAAPAPLPASVAPTTATDLPTLVGSAQARYTQIVDFEARLVKREVVNGKPMPTEEAEYRFRQKPFSVYLKVTSEAGEGREVLYVQGRDDRGMHLVTGKGDHFLRGFKTTLPLNDPRLTAKSRYKASEAGFGRTLIGLSKGVAEGRAKLVGPELRPEYSYPLMAIQITIPNGGEPQMPRGGTRTVYLDPKPDSVSYLMPVLVVTREPDGKEVEYYLFDRIRLPANFTDADFDPNMLGKR